MSNYSVREYRSRSDFKWGSFDVYVADKVIYIHGILKKSGAGRGKYMKIEKKS